QPAGATAGSSRMKLLRGDVADIADVQSAQDGAVIRAVDSVSGDGLTRLEVPAVVAEGVQLLLHRRQRFEILLDDDAVRLPADRQQDPRAPKAPRELELLQLVDRRKDPRVLTALRQHVPTCSATHRSPPSCVDKWGEFPPARSIHQRQRKWVKIVQA